MKKILLIDDEPTSLLGVVRRLKSSDYEVLTAKWGENGIDKVKSIQPDLILLDVKMPEIDGFSALDLLKQTFTTKHIPVIMISGYYLDDTTVEMAKSLGAEEFFEKTAEPEELVEKVTKFLSAGH